MLVLVAPARAQTSAPFVLPVALPPGPNTWLLGQPYGNTVGAFLRGDDWYRAGQRLHFGIDLSMPCGTPLVAIGDGEVVGVSDLSFGSAPHNLLIRHDAGYVSLYGHLLERPLFVPGQRVVQGQEVGLSGDPDLTCTSRPHLHVEIRSLDYRTAYNPVPLIAADWDTLALIGQFRYPMFQQDLDNARRWLTLADQPTVAFGGQALNRYLATYPTIDMLGALPNTLTPRPPFPQSEGDVQNWLARRVGFDGCCANVWWSTSDPNLLYFIDGTDGARASVYEWDVALAGPTGQVTGAPPPLLSPDGTRSISMTGSSALITRLADGSQWTVETGGAVPSINPDNSALLVARTSDILLPGESSPRTTVWVSDMVGGSQRVIADVTGVTGMWLDNTRVLLWQRTPDAMTHLFVHETAQGQSAGLASFMFLRGLSVAPGGGRLLFYLAYQDDPNASGVYTLETQPGAQPQRLPWFGAWRWRDADSVYYVPFAPGQPHVLRSYHIPSASDVALTDPTVTPFTIANGDWSVSADGSRIAFWNALDQTTWVLEAP
ncbi:MAG: M23 family metallopeptidase [Chloroflexota bacterium]|nr:M23 family metallopeptidase [Chloroflexota bacterium]